MGIRCQGGQSEHLEGPGQGKTIRSTTVEAARLEEGHRFSTGRRLYSVV
jgi:hypothetical protein